MSQGSYHSQLQALLQGNLRNTDISTANSQHFPGARYQNDGSGMFYPAHSGPTTRASMGAVQHPFASSSGVQAPNPNLNMVPGPAQSPYGNQTQYLNNQPYAMPDDLSFPGQFWSPPAQVPLQILQALQQLPPQAPEQPDLSSNFFPGSSTYESTLDPALQTFPQTASPQETVQQGTIIQRPALQQPIPPEAFEPQATVPLQASQQASHQQLYTEETFQQPVQPSSSQQDTTQAYQPKANQLAPAFDYAQESYPQAALPAHYHTYEEKWAAFRPVPELHPNPFPKEGKAGRKPKPQRFWPHPDASEDLRRRYSELQQADANVTKAEKKLLKNSRASQDAHFQNILLRNMATRDNLWTICERMEQGMAAVELSVEAAGAKTKKCHEAWTKIRDGLTKKEAHLGTEYPSAVNYDGTINTRLVEHRRTGQGLQTRRNWNQKHIKDLRDAFEALRNALLRRHGDDEHLPKRVLQHAHALGCYPGFVEWMWPGDSQDAVIYREMYEDPDESTWLDGPLPTLGDGQQDEQMQGLQEVLEMPENPQFVEGPEGAHDIAYPEPQAAQQETAPMPEQVYDQVQFMGEQPVPAPMPEQNNDQMQFVGEQPLDAPMPDQNDDQMQFVGEQPVAAPMPEQNDDQDAEMMDGGGWTSDWEEFDWDAPDAFTASLNEVWRYVRW